MKNNNNTDLQDMTQEQLVMKILLQSIEIKTLKHEVKNLSNTLMKTYLEIVNAKRQLEDI